MFVPPTPPKELTATLVEKEFLNPKVVSLKFTTSEPFEYKAGQFIGVYFADPENPSKTLMRAYSIASSPAKPYFELCVGIIPNGKCSNYLANLEVNDEINIKGPYGTCYIKPENKNNLVMVGTGTGIAPIKGILEDLALKKDTRTIDVLFGVRFAEDLFYLKELQELSADLEDSNIMMTLSRPHELWTGHEGRVTQHLQHIKFDPLVTDFYICGNGDMITEVRNFALEAGIDKKNIHVEIFD